MKHNFHIQRFDCLPSTNDYAKEHIKELKEGSVILCDQQTKGRGRFDRVWISKHDLTFSLVTQQLQAHNLMIPCAIIEACKSFGITAYIKWPNDIIVDDAKVCGILIETVYEGNQVLKKIIGIGVNLSPLPLDLQHKASYLCLDKEALLEEILSQYEHLSKLTNKEILYIYRKANYLQGRKILYDAVLWNVIDVNEEGCLVIKNKETTRILNSEEITLSHIY